MREEKQTFLDLIIGIVLLSILLSIVGVILAEDKLAFFLGVIFGSFAAAGLCLHMYKTLEETLDMDEEGASKRAKSMAGVRMFLMAVTVFAAILFSETISVVGTILGILTLKFAAFIQPMLHENITKKIFDKGR